MTHTMQINTQPFFAKHRQPPENNRRGIWRFRIEDEELTIWGTMKEAISTAKLCAMMDDIPATDIVLLDYTPFPKIMILEAGPEG